MSKQMSFLKATRGGGWKTLEALVADLDRAGYWKGEPGPVQKRRHVRKMLATLVFREAAGQTQGAERHVFVSTLRAGETVRVYKQVFSLTPAELRDVQEAGAAERASRSTSPARLLEGDGGGEALLLDELAEETMRRAWPGASLVQRRRVVLAALIQHRRSEEASREVSERCRAEGFDVEKILDEYLRAAGASRLVDAQEASNIAGSATEYFKVLDELEGMNLGKRCFEVFMEARTNAIEEFAQREDIDFKEAATLFAGELGEYADEFQGVLEIYWRDRFGWTLDEHLQFALERR